MYFIESGKAVVLGKDKKSINNELEPGQYFGEYAALTGDKRLATVKAKGNVVLYEVDRVSLLELIKENPKLYSFFLKRVYAQTTTMYTQLQTELQSRTKIFGLRIFRNVKIGTKILGVILFTSLLTLIVISGLSYSQMLNLSRYSQETITQLGAAMTNMLDLPEEAGAEIDAFTGSAGQVMEKSLSDILLRFGLIFIVSAVLVSILGFILSLTIIRPIEELAVGVKRFGTGNLDNQIVVEGKDEITELAKAFNKMTLDLKEYIKNLETVTGEKERINGELSVAADIQNDMLPNISSKFKSFEWVDLYARMEPAKQVGGDFYDFFYLNEEESKLAFVIADVSGKGVPAALFMVIAKTLLKTHMLQGLKPAAALAGVNAMLSEDNSLSMFVTVFICSLDLQTGILHYANGGHNRPLISLSGSPYQYMELKKGIPLGLLEGSKYHDCELQMQPGDKLYLYTDGVNEAMNPEGKELGNAAFLEGANKFRDLPSEQFDEAIRGIISHFADGEEQSDDITTMAISFLQHK
jgi:serine phosphatase RsbU (regulator of sigma subunit)